MVLSYEQIQAFGGSDQIAFADDVVSLKDRSRLVAGHLHRDAFGVPARTRLRTAVRRKSCGNVHRIDAINNGRLSLLLAFVVPNEVTLLIALEFDLAWQTRLVTGAPPCFVERPDWFSILVKNAGNDHPLFPFELSRFGVLAFQ
jgi:hypothetical protein